MVYVFVFAEKKDETVDQMDKSRVNVRLRWTKVEPGVDRIVHLISNLVSIFTLVLLDFALLSISNS